MISLSKVGKSYGDTVVLREADLEVGAGEVIGITGPSGCGKTTLLRLIAGLELPDTGAIRIAGSAVTDRDDYILPHRRGIGFAFQEPALWPHMTVAQNILFGVADSCKASRRDCLAELLHAVELAGMEHRRPSQLSLGQARRVALARALAPEPRILLLDEPLTSIDANLHAKLLELIRQRQQKSQAALIYVSHAIDEIRSLCIKAYSLGNGGIEPLCQM